MHHWNVRYRFWKTMNILIEALTLPIKIRHEAWISMSGITHFMSSFAQFRHNSRWLNYTFNLLLPDLKQLMSDLSKFMSILWKVMHKIWNFMHELCSFMHHHISSYIIFQRSCINTQRLCMDFEISCIKFENLLIVTVVHAWPFKSYVWNLKN